MQCPRDGVVLEPVNVCGVDLDKCHKCDGLWCDYSELRHLQTSGVPELEAKMEEKYGNPSVTEGAVERYMPCPVCPDGRLHRYRYTYARPISIDRCNRCHGVWLDQGELDGIIVEVTALAAVKSEAGLAGFFKKLRQLLP